MRNYITMPTGTTVAGTASTSPVPIYSDTIEGVFASAGNNGNNLVNIISNGNLITYQAADAGSATRMVSQILYAMTQNGAGTVIVDSSSSLSWASITPNTTNTTQHAMILVGIGGTGFLASGINALKLDNGIGSVALGYTIVITSDTTIGVTSFDTGGPNFVASTYLLYYSTDGGATWTSTTLTVGAS